MARATNKDMSDAVTAAEDCGTAPLRDPIQPPELELFAQRIAANVGVKRQYIVDSYKEAGIDPLAYPMFKTWDDVPEQVKQRVRFLMKRTASATVADRREVEEFLTAIIRDDPRLAGRSDRKKLFTMDAVRELCKMRGFYSPVEVRNTHEIVVPDSMRRMSDEELAALCSQAADEVIEGEAYITPVPQIEEAHE